ncbi:hypothetical protein TELCIR_11035, partial [Teladorsagia circumcincta]
YGNTAAKTYIGKTLTMLYAIIGIPLMLLFLTNIGDVMAKIFRFLYAQSIRLKFRLILWHKKRKAAKIRRANSLVSRLTRAHRVKNDSSIDSFAAGGPDVEDLLTARVEMEQLEKFLAEKSPKTSVNEFPTPERVQTDPPKDKKQILMSDDGPSFMKRAQFYYRSQRALEDLMRL